MKPKKPEIYDESCGVCWHNVNNFCKKRRWQIFDPLMNTCGLFKLQRCCVICKTDIQDDDTVYCDTAGGRVCRECSNAIYGEE